ncbi:MAG TPA: altronate dehydratase family protein, partial [Rhodothermales bacterium]|nr:altronate dehydratase family protein [Rhodothermales bacterium]
RLTMSALIRDLDLVAPDEPDMPPVAPAVGQAPALVRVHEADNVAVAVTPIPASTRVSVGGVEVEAQSEIPFGHKVALRPIAAGEGVVKYGHRLGSATEAIAPGAHVHTHNLRTDLSDALSYTYEPFAPAVRPATGLMPTFQGYRRAGGRVGTRNEVWIVNTVGCVNHAADRIARIAGDRFAGVIDGMHSFSHPYGCSQLGDDLVHTQRVLAGLMRHPNAGGVLVLGLGCENNQMDHLLALAGDVDRARLRFFNTQDVTDEVEEGVEAVADLVALMQQDRREPCPLSDLVVGLKCGGSDAFSGLTANPLVGRIADAVTAHGGTAILTEVPEMFGAEQLLMNRAASPEVFEKTVTLVNDFKAYFQRHGQPVYENPSPGNKAGGLTTLEEKSLGATQKGGSATVTQVLAYGEPVQKGGLALLEAPGNDGVSVTAEVASGATVVLFTTGRGTPLGFPVPTLKISSNSDLAARKPHWIDFDAGRLLAGASMDTLADELLGLILRVASGEQQARNEVNGYREIAIWKSGVTL